MRHRTGRLLAAGVLVSVLWCAYAAGAAVLFALSKHSAVIVFAHLMALLMLVYLVVSVWRQYGRSR